MRFPKDQKAKTRERILDAAATVFRRQGYRGGGVDAVMREAGLTAGAFYAHFPSKDALFAEAVVHALRKATVFTGAHLDGLSGAEWVAAAVGWYLSPQHRERSESGCPLPPLLAEVARGPSEARSGFEKELRAAADAIAGQAGDADDALAVLALMIGGMSLARGVADEELSNRILAACRRAADTVSRPKPVPEKKPKKERK
ncbi:HTH-type transcriptional regulator AcrR [Gemmata sp. SH-PL17]|uniref:TetR/AcrR family transcriptional regulator n=1 Tax=Gemmata sp. SH-PL17 TaxID=1630693 RepID=UPI00078E18C6|nr:TetR/AcrR family transcriptional regulator [Gemmata sp. SH-PL17]AMV28104.1 HTH-type transcriptional regulator AcrR [Gemmata sp. SH-PL17]